MSKTKSSAHRTTYYSAVSPKFPYLGTVSWWILKTSWFLKNFDFKKNHCLSSFPRWLTTLATWKQSYHEDSKCNFSFLKNYIGTLSKALFSGSKRRSRGWMYSVKDAKRSKLAFPKFCRNILLKIINFYLFSCIPASNGWLRWQETIFSFKVFVKNPKWEDSLNINGISVFHQKQLLKEIVGNVYSSNDGATYRNAITNLVFHRCTERILLTISKILTTKERATAFILWWRKCQEKSLILMFTCFLDWSYLNNFKGT